MLAGTTVNEWPKQPDVTFFSWYQPAWPNRNPPM
jgi:hypothetical protein